MKVYQQHGKLYYLHHYYLSSKKLVAIYITTNELPNEANKFIAKLTFENKKDRRKSLVINTNVISMVEAPQTASQIVSSTSVAFIPWLTIDAWSEMVIEFSNW